MNRAQPSAIWFALSEKRESRVIKKKSRIFSASPTSRCLSREREIPRVFSLTGISGVPRTRTVQPFSASWGERAVVEIATASLSQDSRKIAILPRSQVNLLPSPALYRGSFRWITTRWICSPITIASSILVQAFTIRKILTWASRVSTINCLIS